MATAFIFTGAMARQPERGYRGFIDWSNDLRSEQMWSYMNSRSTILYTGVSTSHGYQFTPWLYTGAGIEYEYNSKLSSYIVTPFLHGRTDLQFGKFTPFGEIRLGYNMTDGGGVYFSPNIGYRFNWGRKVGINLGLGVSVLGYKMPIYEIAPGPDGYNIVYEAGSYRGTRAYFSFRIGFDF